MPAYRVQLSEAHAQLSLLHGHDSMVVFAGTSADAIAVAKGQYPGDAGAAWAAATATEVVAGTELGSNYSLRVAILDSVPVIDETATGVLGCSSVSAVAAGGTLYAANDVLTLVGGTFTRAATYNVVTEAAGVVTVIELIDPGEYTVAPTSPIATTNDGSGDDACTLTGVFTSDEYVNFFGEMVGLLNANSIIAGAAFADNTPLFTISSIGDALGDLDAVVEFMNGDEPIPGLLGAVTDGGVSGAVLSVASIAAPVLPRMLESYKKTS